MPKLTLTFDMPEEREEAELAQSAGRLHCMLYDIAMYARSLRKYEERTELPKDEVVDKLHELLSEFEY